MKNELINLNKYISSSGFCSRRDADKLIEQARVTVNGELVLPGARIDVGDVVEVDGEPIKKKTKARPIYIAFNKPVGVTSTTDVHDKSNIIYFMNYPKRIFPVGRLDKDSDGLIFLTNDGDIVNKILRASNNHEKEYIVNVDRAVTPEFVRQMSNGVPVLGKMTSKCFVRQEGSRRFRIILKQGLNRQIRRMCEYLDYKVVSLSRVRIMNVELGNLPVGKWRYFTLPEIEQMNELVATSSKTDSGSKAATKEAKVKQYIPKRKSAETAAPEPEESSRPERPVSRKRKSYADFRAGSEGEVRPKGGRGKRADAGGNDDVPARGARKSYGKPAAAGDDGPVRGAKKIYGKPAAAGKSERPAQKAGAKPDAAKKRSTARPAGPAGKGGAPKNAPARAAGPRDGKMKVKAAAPVKRKR